MLSPIFHRCTSTLPAITVDRALAFEHYFVRSAAEYWNSLRGDRPMPSRGELKPAAMRSFLRFVSIVDIRPATGTYRVVLQSSHSRDVFGDLVDREFGELFPPEVAQRWRDCFNLVRDTAEPVRLSTQVGTHGKLWLQCEMFIAPLSGSPESSELASLYWIFYSWDRPPGATIAA